MGEKFDFSGWVTKYGTLCTDGRTLKDGAFAHCDGKTVPMAWQHDHDNPSNILGKILLEHVPGEGVYGYGTFNDTEAGKDAKILVKHGDIDSLSIFANHLQERGYDVYHGDIKEVSLVLASANPEAHIDNVLVHSDGANDPYVDKSKGEIWTCPGEFEFDVERELKHSDEEEEKMDEQAIYDSLNPDQKALFDMLLDEIDDDELAHADDADEEIPDFDEVVESMTDTEKDAMNYFLEVIDKTGGDPDKLDSAGIDQDKFKSIKNTIDNMSDEKQLVVMYNIGLRANDQAMAHSDINETNTKEEPEMVETIFDKKAPTQAKKTTLSHADTDDIITFAKKNSVTSLRELVAQKVSKKKATLKHADDEEEHVPATYGVDYIDYLFPDAQAVTEKPEFIQRDAGWVSVWMNGTKHYPFSRIKTIFADITEDAARAKGYIKGTQKKSEVFPLLKRVTEPCRIYKMQKFDKDDLDDIRWDIIPWIKAEMRGQVDEEIARAGLVGDGREAGVDNDKIDETKIRPVVTDADLYTIKIDVEGTNPTEIAAQLPDTLTLAMDDYKGSGNVVGFIKQSLYTRLLITKDGMGYRLYKSPTELASAMSVTRLVPVPNDIMGDNYVIALDLRDYGYGSERGGQMSTFDDFDIDFNQFKYLMEVRLSGALTKPYSTIVLRKKVTAGGNG